MIFLDFKPFFDNFSISNIYGLYLGCLRIFLAHPHELIFFTLIFRFYKYSRKDHQHELIYFMFTLDKQKSITQDGFGIQPLRLMQINLPAGLWQLQLELQCQDYSWFKLSGKEKSISFYFQYGRVNAQITSRFLFQMS